MRYYDSIYKNNEKFCGARPSKLLVKIRKSLKKNDEFLDLGCGQGKDSLYMSKQGLKITAIDNSKVAIKQLGDLIKKKKIINFAVTCKNIKEIIIQPKKFNVIASLNTLQFLAKKDSLIVIEKVKKAIASRGFIVLASFTNENSPSKRRKSCFKFEEMKNLFPKSQFEILHYFEGMIKDSGHIGMPEPHKHGIVQIIARKK